MEESFDVSSFNPQAMFKEMQNFRVNSQKQIKSTKKGSTQTRNNSNQDTYLLSAASSGNELSKNSKKRIRHKSPVES